MEIKSSFDEIYSWQLDEPELSSGTESFCKAMNWFDISNIVSRLYILNMWKS
jgi:hypothetical protein